MIPQRPIYTAVTIRSASALSIYIRCRCGSISTTVVSTLGGSVAVKDRTRLAGARSATLEGAAAAKHHRDAVWQPSANILAA